MLRADFWRAGGGDTSIDDDAAHLEAIPDAIVGVDAGGSIALVNSRAAALFGFERSELVGQPFDALVPAYESTRSSALGMEQGGEAAANAAVACVARRRDDREFPAECSMSEANVGGRDVVLIAIRDVSAKRHSEALARGILDGAPDAILGVRADGTITLANVQAERLFGYGRDDLVGQAVELLVPEAARALHVSHRQQFLEEPATRPMGIGLELAARRADGTEVPVEISLSSIGAADGLLVLAAVRDVTERIEARKEREQLRRQAEQERMQSRWQRVERMESLGQLAGGVAHDFNNLLAVITNYTSFVAEEIKLARHDDPDRWEQVVDDLQQVLRASARATELTRQLLAFGRREIAQPRVVDLNEVVHDVEPMLRRTLGEHIDLVVDVEPEIWNTKLDPGQLEQVLVNLAVNSRDALPEGGRLVIETVNAPEGSDVVKASLVDGDAVALRVSDTGSGMAPDVVARAFEPFFTTKSRGQSSGLGLATVYGIVTQAGGDVLLESTVDVGTTVTVLFPRTTEPAPEDEEHAADARSSQQSTILLVEDEAAMREVTRRMLERLGHYVLTASGGDEAIALADAHDGHIDLLLTDVVMPQKLGKTVAEQITARRPDTRVLFMSGYAQPILASQGTLDHGVHLLEKPFSSDQLAAKVREVLNP